MKHSMVFLSKNRRGLNKKDLKIADDIFLKHNVEINRFYFRASIVTVLLGIVLFYSIAKHLECTSLLQELTLSKVSKVKTMTKDRQ